MRSIPWQATHQFDVFTARQALECGWNFDSLARAARSGRLIRLRKGAYAPPPPAQLDRYERRARLLGQRGVAAALLIPQASVSHAAALAVRDLPTYRAREIPCVTKPQDCRTLQRELHLHRKLLVPKMLDPHLDFACTSVARTCVDVACELGLAAGVIAADAALRRELTTPEELLVARCSVKGDRGSPNAGRMLELMDGRAESPLESLSRVGLVGLVPPPLIQPRIYRPDGRFLGRVDFLWEELGLIGEADGKAKYTKYEGTLDDEKLRQDAFAETNAVFARWGWYLAERPNQLAAYVHERMEIAWRRRAAGLRPQMIVVPS